MLAPEGIEGLASDERGLGFLEHETVIAGAKTLRQVTGVGATVDVAFAGYEMHVGKSTGGDAFRREFLRSLGVNGAFGPAYEAGVEEALDAVADAFEEALDIDRLLATAE